MQALLLNGPGDFQWKRVADPRPGPRQVLVRVRRCGVATSDLRAWAGQIPALSYPRRLGHEMCVEVVTSPDPSLAPGDLCALNPYGVCGQCVACRGGHWGQCRDQPVLGVNCDGAYAPYLSVAVSKLHRARGLTPDEVALTAVLVRGAHLAECAGIGPGDFVVVIGLNESGLATALFAKHAGAKVAVVDERSKRYIAACARFDLGPPFHPANKLAGRLRRHFGASPTLVVDTTGNADSMKEAFKLADDRGRVAFTGLFPGQEVFHYPDFNHWPLTQLVGRSDLDRTFARVIALMSQKAITLPPLISHRWNFAATPENFASLASEQGLFKGMINFDP
jgi:threonine dehydrogenase-like Zn-dependent dehydrogenase